MKLVSFLLISSLLLLCFSGCGEAPVTPTDSPVSSVESKVETMESQTGIEGFEEYSGSSKPENTNQTVSSEVPAESSAKKEQAVVKPTKNPSSTVSEDKKQSAGSSNGQQTAAGLAREYPEFSNESGFKNWLLGKTEGFSQERANALSVMANGNTVTYYRPSAMFSSSTHTFDHVLVENGSYLYIFEGVARVDSLDKVWIRVHHEKRDTYDQKKQKCLNQEERYDSVTVDGIEYYCFLNDFKETVVDWEQNGQYFYAWIAHGCADPVNEVLPLLKMEAATLRTDVVTQ